MLCQQSLALGHEFVQKGCRSLRLWRGSPDEMVAPWLAGYVVWRSAIQPLVSALYDKEVPVLNARVETYPLVAEVVLQVAYQYVSLLGIEPSAGMVLQEVAFKADEVAPHGEVVGIQFHPDAGGFERSPALIYQSLVVAEYAAVSHLATRVESVGYRP